MPIYKSPYEINHLMTAPERVAFWLSTIPSVVLVRADLAVLQDAIDVESPEFETALNALVDAGIITQARVPQIKSGVSPNG